MSARKVLDFLGKGVPKDGISPLLSNRAWINGQWVEAEDKGSFPVTNPANLDLITQVFNNNYNYQLCHNKVPDMRRDDVLEAIESSYAAQKSWSQQTAKVIHC